jgi:RNA polymerase sigma-70 factor (ECF subfamily)
MNEWVGRMPGSLVSEAEDLEREFDVRLADSSTLAFRVAYSVLRHRQDAEDVAQEAFAKAHRSFRQLRDRERFRAWLVRMTWRMALDKRRGDVRRMIREQAPPDISPAPSAEDAVIAEERAARLWRAIDELPEKLRMAIVLSAIDGHDIREVARLTSAPEGTVKSRLFEARKRLQELLSCDMTTTR